MTKFLCTIWALILNTLGITIFRTCFANAMEDEEGEALITGPPITSFFFACGIYTIIVSSSLFPTNFRKPKAYILCAYEFLATAFFLEFSIACIWTPIDVLVFTTFPQTICKILVWMDFNETAKVVMDTKVPMVIITCLLTLGFFVLSLHTTKSLDFTLLIDCGWSYFFEYATDSMWRRILNELPKRNKTGRGRCGGKKSGRRRRRSSS